MEWSTTNQTNIEKVMIALKETQGAPLASEDSLGQEMYEIPRGDIQAPEATENEPVPENPNAEKEQEKSPCIPGIYTSWMNILLIFIPVSIPIYYCLPEHHGLIFLTSFLAIIPLASMIGTATEQIALMTNDAIGGFLNATFGNAVEMILAIIALKNDYLRIVQSTLVGSILSNTLLVLGCAFFFGGLKRDTMRYTPHLASTTITLLFLVICIICMPAILVITSLNHFQSEGSEPINSYVEIESLSRASSLLLLVCYLCFLFFQMYTHKHLFDGLDDDETPELSLWHSILILIVTTGLVTLESEFIVGSIEPVALSYNINPLFIAVILLPIVGNAAEHIAAVTLAMKNKVDLAVQVCVGSGLQIAMFVAPFMVVVGWAMDKPMTLFFHTFETVILLLSSLLVQQLLHSGVAQWLDGLVLMVAYIVIGLTFFFHPWHDHWDI